MNRRQFGLLAAASAALANSQGSMATGEKPHVLHVAWLRFNPEVTQAQIESHFEACRSLVGKVPVVLDLQCGANITDRADGMTHGIVVTLKDRDSIGAYLDHPEHVRVVTPLRPDVAELRVMDIEI